MFRVIRRLYEWVLSFAYKRYGLLVLYLIAFLESSIFPIPPDVLLIGLCLSRIKRSYIYALVCTLGSVMGGIFGYYIGYSLWAGLGGVFFEYVPGITETSFLSIKSSYEQYNFWVVFTAGFTPIPYKVITLTAGIFGINFPIFVLASLISRGARFLLISYLLSRYGETVNVFIDKYFNLLTVVFLLLLILFYIVFNWV